MVAEEERTGEPDGYDTYNQRVANNNDEQVTEYMQNSMVCPDADESTE